MLWQSDCFPNDFAAIESRIFARAWAAGDFPAGADHLYVSVWADGECLAYAYVRCLLDEGELYRIAVLPEYRRRGLARALLDRLGDLALTHQVAQLFLEVSILNQAALAFYEAYGWVQTGQRKNYYGPEDHGVLMKLDLKNRG